MMPNAERKRKYREKGYLMTNKKRLKKLTERGKHYKELLKS